MRKIPECPVRPADLLFVVAMCGLAASAPASVSLDGTVVDLNGRPIVQAQVTVRTGDSHAGADLITVFTGDGGRFSFPEAVTVAYKVESALTARSLGYDLLHVTAEGAADDLVNATIVMTKPAAEPETTPPTEEEQRVDVRGYVVAFGAVNALSNQLIGVLGLIWGALLLSVGR